MAEDDGTDEDLFRPPAQKLEVLRVHQFHQHLGPRCGVGEYLVEKEAAHDRAGIRFLTGVQLLAGHQNDIVERSRIGAQQLREDRVVPFCLHQPKPFRVDVVPHELLLARGRRDEREDGDGEQLGGVPGKLTQQHRHLVAPSQDQDAPLSLCRRSSARGTVGPPWFGRPLPHRRAVGLHARRPHQRIRPCWPRGNEAAMRGHLESVFRLLSRKWVLGLPDVQGRVV